jgi:hypothetical protein
VLRRLTEDSNRTVTYVAWERWRSSWGSDRDIRHLGRRWGSPDTVVAVAFLLSWGAVLAALTMVFWLAGDVSPLPQIEGACRGRP